MDFQRNYSDLRVREEELLWFDKLDSIMPLTLAAFRQAEEECLRKVMEQVLGRELRPEDKGSFQKIVLRGPASMYTIAYEGKPFGTVEWQIDPLANCYRITFHPHLEYR